MLPGQCPGHDGGKGVERSGQRLADWAPDAMSPRSARVALASPLQMRRAPRLPDTSPQLDDCLRNTFPSQSASPMAAFSPLPASYSARTMAAVISNSSASSSSFHRRKQQPAASLSGGRSDVLDRLSALSMRCGGSVSADLSSLVAARTGDKSVDEQSTWAMELLELVSNASSPASRTRTPLQPGRIPLSPYGSSRDRSFHNKRSPPGGEQHKSRVGWACVGPPRGVRDSPDGGCSHSHASSSDSSKVRASAWADPAARSSHRSRHPAMMAPPTAQPAPAIAFSRKSNAVWTVNEPSPQTARPPFQQTRAAPSSGAAAATQWGDPPELT